MRKHKPNYWIAIFSLALLALGMVVIFGIGPRVRETEGFSDSYYYVVHHFIFVAGAVLVMIVFALDWQEIAARIFGGRFGGRFRARRGRNEAGGNYKLLASWSGKMTLLAFVLCFLVPILGAIGSPLVSDAGGAYRRFRIPGVGDFQVVEFLKLALLFYLPMQIEKFRAKNAVGSREFWIVIFTVVAAVFVSVSWMQKDLGSTVVILFMIFCMMLIAGVPSKQIAIMVVALLAVVAAMIVFQPHRVQRLAGFGGEGDSYHLENSLIGIGSGGLLGVGLGNSTQSTGYLPEAMSDSIFSVICESWGFVGAVAIMLLFLLLLMNVIKVARHTEDFAQKMTVIGVFAWIFAHVIINVLGMIGVIPMKGITLSFLSYGGASLVFTGAAVGVVLQISGWTKREVVDEDSSSRRGQRWARDAGRRGRA